MLASVTPVKTQRDTMELKNLTPTFERAGELLDISRALADGDNFREELTAFIRKAGISDRILATTL